jgi:hypothetical protein
MVVSLLWVLCIFKWRSLRRDDLSSRGALPTVVSHCVWTRNLKNGVALDRDEILRLILKRTRHSSRWVCIFISYSFSITEIFFLSITLDWSFEWQHNATPSLFWEVTWHGLGDGCGRFGTAYHSRIQGSRIPTSQVTSSPRRKPEIAHSVLCSFIHLFNIQRSKTGINHVDIEHVIYNSSTTTQNPPYCYTDWRAI